MNKMKRNEEIFKKGLISKRSLKKVDPELLDKMKKGIEKEDAKTKSLCDKLEDLNNRVLLL
jgi:hypothetical protein